MADGSLHTITRSERRPVPAYVAPALAKTMRAMFGPVANPSTETFAASQVRFARSVLSAMASDRRHPRVFANMIPLGRQRRLAMLRLASARSYRLNAREAS